MENIKRIGNKVFINAQDIGWHCAGRFIDAKANWPQYATEVDLLEQEYLAEKAELEAKRIADEAEANRKYQESLEKQKEQRELAEKQFEEDLQKRIDAAVAAALKNNSAS